MSNIYAAKIIKRHTYTMHDTPSPCMQLYKLGMTLSPSPTCVHTKWMPPNGKLHFLCNDKDTQNIQGI